MVVSTIIHHLLFVGALIFLSAVITRLMIRARIIDRPNQRSSHIRPVPRSGGVAIVITSYVGLAVVLLLGDQFAPVEGQIFGLSVAAGIVASAGFLDDLNVLESYKTKLFLQLLAGSVALYSGVLVDRIPIPYLGSVQLGWWGYPVTLLWLVALTNIFNFMDGLDGLAVGTAAIVMAIFGLIAIGHDAAFVPALSFVLFAACLGFLFFNFPRAKIFMGDVGSQFLGFVIAALAVLATGAGASSISVYAIPLLFFHFIFDAVFTLFRRLVAGEDVTEAHKSHLYQLLNQLGLTHAQVSMLHFLIAIAQGIGVMTLPLVSPSEQVLIFLPFLAFQIIYAIVILHLAKNRGVA